MPAHRSDAGGRAGAGGFDYQHRVAAWFATHVLGGAGFTPDEPLWHGPLRRIDLETGDAVDDVRLTPENASAVMLQCKRTIVLSEGERSDLAKTVTQFVGHHLADGHEDDKLVLVTSSAASSVVHTHLRQVLDRLREADADASVDDVSANKDDRRAVEVFTAHIVRAWELGHGRPPTEREQQGLLRRCHVLVLDLHPGEAHEIVARDRLRLLVAGPDAADAAWDALVEQCARLATDGSGADRSHLQWHLASRGIALATAPDFGRDVDRLQSVTTTTLEMVETSGIAIPTADGSIDLDRPVVRDLVQQSTIESLMVVGDPGIGKTVALHHLARHELDEGRPVLFLSVGDIGATSRGELRTELGLDHELLDVLPHWSPGIAKLLVVDALDAARTDPQAKMWRTLLGQVQKLPDWQVVASIRTWDLENSAHLRAVFPSPPVDVTELTDDELDQLRAASPKLEALVASASPELEQLLRNPFNLRLAAELLVAGLPIGELHAIESRLQLLDRYWQHRVSDGSGRITRTQLLAGFSEYAVANRTMVVPTSVLVARDSAAGDYLETLLSRSVLTDATATPARAAVGAVRVAHHVLFDYVVAITLFGTTDEALVERLRDDPDLVLFVRPSMDMHLERLWTQDLEAFWKTARRLAADIAVPRIAEVAAAEVAARRTRHADDLTPLLDAAIDGPEAAEDARLLRFVAVAADIDLREGDTARLDVWAEVVSRLAAHLPALELPLRILLDALAREHQDGLEPDELAKCGHAARRSLAYLWEQPPSRATQVSIDAVVATAVADSYATDEVLREVLDTNRLSEHGPTVLHALTESVPELAGLLPEFVEDLYGTLTLHEETSTEETELGGSLILRLRSNRRQDFEHAQWALVQKYPDYFAAAPSHALRAIKQIILAVNEGAEVLTGDICGRQFEVIADNSHRWDEGGYRSDRGITGLLDALEAVLTEASDSTALEELIDRLAAEPMPAGVWRHVLKAAAKNPELAERLLPLDELVVALTHPDLAGPLSQVIHQMFPDRPDEERRRLEGAVLSLRPEDEQDDLKSYNAAVTYRRLLYALDANSAGEDIIAAQAAAAGPPTDVGQEGEIRAGFNEHHAAEFASQIDEEAWELITQLRSFNEQHLNAHPSDAAVASCRDTLQRLLSMVEENELSEPVRGDADAALASAAEVWTRRESDVGEEVLSVARDVLLRYRDDPRPTDDPNAGDRLSLIPQGPRTDAARGLVQLAGFPELCDDEVLDAIRSLSNDRLAWIRYFVARDLPFLRNTASGLMWELLEDRATNDPHDGVLRGAALGAYTLANFGHEARALGLLGRVAQRARPTDEHDSALEACTGAVGMIWVSKANQVAADILELLTDLERLGTDGLRSMLHKLRASGSFTCEDEEVRARTHDLCSQLTDRGIERVEELLDLEASPERDSKLNNALHLLDALANQIYFASHAHSRPGDDPDDPLPAEDVRLADEFGDVIVQLGATPVPSVTHRLVELLEHVLDARPAWALGALRDILIKGGQQGGYHLDSTAMESALEIVTRLLADHREVLQDPVCLAAIREILDLFIDAGWPRAHRLVFRLDEIYR